jgi:ankyrin repeat protein
MKFLSKLKKYTNKLRYSLSGGANLGVNIGNKALDTIVMCAQNGFTKEVLPFIHLDRSFDVDTQLWSAMKNKRNWITGKTPLMCASYSGNLAKVNLLLSLGVDIDEYDANYKYTAVISAIAGNKLDVFNRLIEVGAQLLDLKLSYDINPLYLAFKSKCSNQFIDRLLALGLDPEGPYNGRRMPMLMYVCMLEPSEQPDVTVFNKIIDYFGLIGVVYYKQFHFPLKSTPLIEAIRKVNEDYVYALLERGTTITDVDSFERNALFYANLTPQYGSDDFIKKAERIRKRLQLAYDALK